MALVGVLYKDAMQASYIIIWWQDVVMCYIMITVKHKYFVQYPMHEIKIHVIFASLKIILSKNYCRPHLLPRVSLQVQEVTMVLPAASHSTNS